MLQPGFVRVHYFNTSMTADLLPHSAGALIANGLAEEIDETGKPVDRAAKEAQYMEGVSAPSNKQEFGSIVPHTDTATIPRPHFARQPRGQNRAFGV
jgi:hypothetical protein